MMEVKQTTHSATQKPQDNLPLNSSPPPPSSMAKTEDETGPLYATRSEWKDITPVPQYAENANPIAPIFYTEACAFRTGFNFDRLILTRFSLY